MVNLLLNKGANLSTCDKKERQPIHWAAFLGMFSSLLYGLWYIFYAVLVYIWLMFRWAQAFKFHSVRGKGDVNLPLSCGPLPPPPCVWQTHVLQSRCGWWADGRTRKGRWNHDCLASCTRRFKGLYSCWKVATPLPWIYKVALVSSPSLSPDPQFVLHGSCRDYWDVCEESVQNVHKWFVSCTIRWKHTYGAMQPWDKGKRVLLPSRNLSDCLLQLAQLHQHWNDGLEEVSSQVDSLVQGPVVELGWRLNLISECTSSSPKQEPSAALNKNCTPVLASKCWWWGESNICQSEE